MIKCNRKKEKTRYNDSKNYSKTLFLTFIVYLPALEHSYFINR